MADNKRLYSPWIVSSESLLSSYKRIASFNSNCVDMVHGSPEINFIEGPMST